MEDGSIELYHKGARHFYCDGTVGGDLPMQRLSELFNVNTFIVSQVNPYVLPFVTVDGGGILQKDMQRRAYSMLK